MGSLISSTSISQQINTDINEISNLLDALKKEDGKSTEKDVKDLLIQYILATIAHDTAEAKEAEDKISSEIQKYGNDMKKVNGLKAEVQSVKGNPNDQTAAELAQLQSLISVVKQDLSTGNMSNL